MIREQNKMRLYDFWTMCLACWFTLLAIYEFVFLSKIFISVLPRTVVLVSGVLFSSCDKAFFSLMFAVFCYTAK